MSFRKTKRLIHTTMQDITHLEDTKRCSNKYCRRSETKCIWYFFYETTISNNGNSS